WNVLVQCVLPRWWRMGRRSSITIVAIRRSGSATKTRGFVMKSKKLSAQRPGNRSNGSAFNGSSDDLTKRNVEIIKQLEDDAKQERTKSDLVAEAIARFCGSMTFVWVHVGWFGGWVVLNVISGMR